MANRNIPFIITRWPVIKPFRNNLYTWDFHPFFSAKRNFSPLEIEIDLESGRIAQDNTNPNKSFLQLINSQKRDPEEIHIFTDGSRNENGNFEWRVGAAYVIPSFDYINMD